MLDEVVIGYLGPVEAILVIISMIAYFLPSRVGERISDVALGAFLGAVFFGLALTMPHFIESVR
jgi:hypothetical protein